MLAMLLVMYLVVLVFLALSALQKMAGQQPTGGLATDGLATTIVLIVGPWLLFLGSIPILIMAPDVHVSGSGSVSAPLFTRALG